MVRIITDRLVAIEPPPQAVPEPDPEPEPEQTPVET